MSDGDAQQQVVGKASWLGHPLPTVSAIERASPSGGAIEGALDDHPTPTAPVGLIPPIRLLPLVRLHDRRSLSTVSPQEVR